MFVGLVGGGADIVVAGQRGNGRRPAGLERRCVVCFFMLPHDRRGCSRNSIRIEHLIPLCLFDRCIKWLL